MAKIRITENNLINLIKTVIKEEINNAQQNTPNLYAIIRYVEPGDDDYDDIWDMYEEDPQKAIDYLAQWDNDECEIVAEEPSLANYDKSYGSDDGLFTLLYNSTIGGCFMLYRDATESEYDWYKDNNGYYE